MTDTKIDYSKISSGVLENFVSDFGWVKIKTFDGQTSVWKHNNYHNTIWIPLNNDYDDFDLVIKNIVSCVAEAAGGSFIEFSKFLVEYYNNNNKIILHNGDLIPSNLFCVVDTNIIEISIINITHVEPNEDDLGFSIAETKPTNTELTTNVSDLYNHYYPKLFIRNKEDLGGLVFTDLNSAKKHVINNIKSQINIKQNEIYNLNKILQELNS